MKRDVDLIWKTDLQSKRKAYFLCTYQKLLRIRRIYVFVGLKRCEPWKENDNYDFANSHTSA
jgi:hypothetical protein